MSNKRGRDREREREGERGREGEGEGGMDGVQMGPLTDIPIGVLFLLQRRSIEHPVLKTKKLDMGEPCQILSLALQPPSLVDIEKSVTNLKEVKHHVHTHTHTHMHARAHTHTHARAHTHTHLCTVLSVPAAGCYHSDLWRCSQSI